VSRGDLDPLRSSMLESLGGLVAGIMRRATELGHPEEKICGYSLTIMKLCRRLLISPEEVQSTLSASLSSTEHTEFVEREYPTLVAGDRVLLPRSLRDELS